MSLPSHEFSPPEPPPLHRPSVTRRRLLGVAALGAAGTGAAAVGAAALRLSGNQSSQPQTYWTDQPDQGRPDQAGDCVASSSLKSAAAVGSSTLVYELSQTPASMRFNPGFHAQLVRWLADWNTRSRYGGVKEIWNYGAHVNKDGCRSFHASGRAFDISRLRAGNTLLVSCRTDLWDEVSAAQRATLTRRYWTLAASLHLHFAYVLTHHFDTLHANHIHVDNGISGAGMSNFDKSSRVQNQAVQAICLSIWGRSGQVTGEWSDTRTIAGPVLAELGLRDLSKQATWQGFLKASVARG